MSYSTDVQIQRLRAEISHLRSLICCSKGGGLPIIEVTLAEYATLLNSNSLTFPAIYAISVTNPLTGVIYVISISNNTVEGNGFARLYVPTYQVTGSFKGQLLLGSSVSTGEKWVWGNKVWQSLNGTNPSPIDNKTLNGTAWQALTPSISNGYILKEFSVITSKPYLTITRLLDNDALNATALETGLLLQWNTDDNPVAYNEEIVIINNLNIGGIYHNRGCTNGTIAFNEIGAENSITYNTLTNGEIVSNTLSGNGNITHNLIRSTCSINNNVISGTGATTINQIGYCELNDNSVIQNNTLSGAGACIWDVRAGENSSVKDNVLSGNETGGPATDSCIITDIDQMNDDTIRNNVLSATDTRIQMIWQYGNSSINNCILDKDGARIERIQQVNSTLSNCSFSSGGAGQFITDVEMNNSTLTEVADININNLVLRGVTLNLFGFDVDIANETIENGRGWFTITHNFGTSPLAAGSDFLYNLIPNGARVSACGIYVESALSGGAGALLSLGVDTDDPTCLLNALAIGTVSDNYSSGVLSVKTTGNRSLRIAATTGDITSGILKIFIEFIM